MANRKNCVKVVLLLVSLSMLILLLVNVAYAGTQPPTTVTISGKVSGDSGTIALKATSKGTALSLAGRGVGVHIDFTSEARFNLAGSISGSMVTLAGTVTQAGFKPLIGTPVSIIADISTGFIAHTFGPIAGGPLAGETLKFTGNGTIIIAPNT